MKNRLSYVVKFARPAVALTAAYALAMQVLLASVLAAGMAAVPPADASVICYGSASESGGKPAHAPTHRADCALSCAQGFSPVAILPDVSPTFIFTAGEAIEPARVAVFILPPRPSPKLAQGPPQNA